MANKPQAQDFNVQNDQGEFPLELDEFCSRLSSFDNRVELIAAFNSVERQAGRLTDTSTAYRARFDAFAVAPV